MSFETLDLDLDDFFVENKEDNHLSVIDRSKLQQYKISLHRNSNITSHILLEDVWKSNQYLFNNFAVEHIHKSVNNLVQNAWKSNLSENDLENNFPETLPNCTSCTAPIEHYGFKEFQKNKCKCDLGNNDTSIHLTRDDIVPTGDGKMTKVEQKKLKPCFSLQNSKPSQQTTSKTIQKPLLIESIDLSKEEEERVHKSNMTKSILKTDVQNFTKNNTEIKNESKVFKQEFDQQKSKKNQATCKTILESLVSANIDLNQEEDDKAHKRHVAKITFKTATERLMASDPATRRILKSSRKVHGKFVSPLIGGVQAKKDIVNEPEMSDERLKNIDPKMIELIENEIIDKGTPIGWDDIAGLQFAKSVIQEAVVWPLLRPDIFTGLRCPPKGILLFGPPGTGKTLIGKCVAAQCNATFFSISASSLTSKWIGDGEKMVRALFAVASCHQPAVIFIDEIDSLLTQRSDTEHEATRRIKTEFLVQFDGTSTGEEDRILVVGATNRPHELDEAARRRLVKRLYIPLPDNEARKTIVSNLLVNENNNLTVDDVTEIANMTEGYSGADMKSLCSEAAMGPVRSVPLSQIFSIDANNVRPVCLQDFMNALERVKPSVSQDDLGHYVKWNKTYGQGF